MRSDGLFKHLAICFVITVVLYAAIFAWIEHRRTFRGPWVTEFRADAAGAPALLVSQSYFHISETIVFPGQSVHSTNLPRTILFSQSPPELPFGELIFQDPMYLPGTVTMRLFGHVVQFLPRVLTVDKKEYPWQTGAVIQVK